MAHQFKPYQLINGKKFPKPFSTEAIQSAIDYKIQDDDIALCTYPKCGTNWVKQIIELLRNEGKPYTDGLDMMYACPFLEQLGVDALKHQSTSKFFMTHFDYETIDKNPKAKYVVVVRNPKDCLVSLYHFTKSVSGAQTMKFESTFESFLTGELGYGCYFDHVLGYYERRNDPNVLFLYYEKIKKDHRGAILQIAEFLGKEYSDLVKDAKILDDIVEYSGFEYMKAHTNDLIDDVHVKLTSDNIDLDSLDLPSGLKYMMKARPRKTDSNNSDSLGLVRKGIVGDGKATLTPEMNERFDEVIRKRLSDTEMYRFWVSEGCL